MYTSLLTLSSPRSDRTRSAGVGPRPGRCFRRSAYAGATAAVAVTTLGLTGAVASSAAVRPAWHPVTFVAEGQNSAFTSVVATGRTSGYVFQSSYRRRPAAYERVGATLRRMAFPSVPNEVVVASGESSRSNVWAFASLPDGHSEAVQLVNGRWDQVKTLGGAITSVSVRARNDVTVFGRVGTYHFNGSSWTRESGAVAGGYSLAAADDWMYRGTVLYHRDGRTEKIFHLAHLLPPVAAYGLNDPQIAGVLALGDRNVYVIGNGRAQDEGGPIVVLHYNGSTWTKVAQYGRGDPGQPSYDGNGGFWLPAGGAGFSELLHYSGGKLVKVRLPGGTSQPTAITGMSRVPGTTEELAVGNLHAADSTAKLYGDLLQYS